MMRGPIVWEESDKQTNKEDPAMNSLGYFTPRCIFLVLPDIQP